MLLIALACVKYPEFSQYRLDPPTQPVPPAPTATVVEAPPTTQAVDAPSPEPLPSLPPPFDVDGTRWVLHYTSPDGPESYPLTFQTGGRALLENPHDSTPDNDAWTQSGAAVTLTMNNAYVTYRGVFTDADVIRGTAANADRSWGFAMVRDGAAPSREMLLDLPADPELVAKLSGTRWSLTDLDPSEPLDMELTLNADGSLDTSLRGPDGEPYAPNSWVASDGALYFWINDRSVEHVAIPTWTDQMVGVALSETGHEWGFLLSAP